MFHFKASLQTHDSVKPNLLAGKWIAEKPAFILLCIFTDWTFSIFSINESQKLTSTSRLLWKTSEQCCFKTFRLILSIKAICMPYQPGVPLLPGSDLLFYTALPSCLKEKKAQTTERLRVYQNLLILLHVKQEQSAIKEPDWESQDAARPQVPWPSANSFVWKR